MWKVPLLNLSKRSRFPIILERRVWAVNHNSTKVFYKKQGLKWKKISRSKSTKFHHWQQLLTSTLLLKTCHTLTIYYSLEVPSFRLPDYNIYSFCFIHKAFKFTEYKHRKIQRRYFLDHETYSLYLHLRMMLSSNRRKFSFFSFLFERSWFICSSIDPFIDKISSRSNYEELFLLTYYSLF